MRAILICIPAGLLMLAGCGLWPFGSPESNRTASTTEREEIYIFRTHRMSRTEGATPACEIAPFPSRQEDFYEFYAVSVDDDTGLITDPSARLVPGFTACLGQISPEGEFPMYATGALSGGGAYAALTTCRIVGVDRPVANAFTLSCAGELREQPEGYAGGFLTSSTLTPSGEGSDVPGYTATSIVTLRLWRAE